MRPVRALASALSLAALGAAFLMPGAAASAASAVGSAVDSADAGRWAPAETATITPGVQMYTAGAQCTANFVFRDGSGRTYVGYAAHCAGTGEATDTNGCEAGSLKLGTPVRFARGGSLASGGETVGRGTLVYSSWRAMRKAGTTANRICANNDFALVRVRAGDVKKVNPSVPFFGGPTKVADAPAEGTQVYTYGSSSARPTDVLSPKTGASLGTTGRGWGFTAYTVTPGIPGDSGSGMLDDQGRAVGTLSTVAIAPLPASNGLGSLDEELTFAQKHSGIAGLRLVRGTEPFTPIP
ncbi:hypothetical protein [uncultured Nocardioides sp.]|uniref:hypothetical protein n=1 Tax=uncultured Nocardioides sp. TaxID=198441 RepID=UPI002637984E|nr:hypothetical protein [uncultured Nocardioides sp.]